MAEKTIAQKLLIKPGYRVALLNPPDGYRAMLEPLPPDVILTDAVTPSVDLVQLFVKDRAQLEAELPDIRHKLGPKTLLWVSYYKGTSRHKADIHRDTINAYGRTLGLEGIAMISLDADWSALRFKQVSAS